MTSSSISSLLEFGNNRLLNKIKSNFIASQWKTCGCPNLSGKALPQTIPVKKEETILNSLPYWEEERLTERAFSRTLMNFSRTLMRFTQFYSSTHASRLWKFLLFKWHVQKAGQNSWQLKIIWNKKVQERWEGQADPKLFWSWCLVTPRPQSVITLSMC